MYPLQDISLADHYSVLYKAFTVEINATGQLLITSSWVFFLFFFLTVHLKTQNEFI